MNIRRVPRQGTLPVEPSSIVKRFLENYDKQHYKHVAKRARGLIEERLDKWQDEREAQGGESEARGDLHVHVHFRAKDKKSLEGKLKMRDAECSYKTEDEIWNDIHDLAGVRIILYTPSEAQRQTIEEIIRAIWKNVQRKDHNGSESRIKPSADTSIQALQLSQSKTKYRRMHPGYTAIHFRVVMEKEHGTENYWYMPRDRVEIQVVSALAHAWAEAGHDILYKSHEYGEPSEQEEKLLDSLNGLVLSGDMLLEQFNELVVKRTYARFRHHYDFGIFLRDLDVLQPQEYGDMPKDYGGEELEVLLRCLKMIKKDYPIAVRDAFISLGYPQEPSVELYFKNNIRPTFEAERNMLDIICLLHVMLPDRLADKAETSLLPKRKCYIMINALILLQMFFVSSELATKFLQETVDMTNEQRKSLCFMMTDNRRQIMLEERLVGVRGFEDATRKEIDTAWVWFDAEARDKKSICGIAFRLAQMGAMKEVDGSVLLGKLTIGRMLSRTSTFSDSSSSDGKSAEGDDRDFAGEVR